MSTQFAKSDEKPTIAITLGDPTGIGPEIIAACWASPELHARCRPLVVGRPEIVARALELRNCSAEVIPVTSVDEAEPSAGILPCLVAGDVAVLDAPPAAIDARGGQAAYDALVAATRLALDEQVDAIVTAPLHKAALAAAGHGYPGHTELLAELCGVDDFAMMLYLPPCPAENRPHGFGVVHTTLHVSLRDAIDAIETKSILAKIHLAQEAGRRLGIAEARIGVCALNPHGGEEGLFGQEEITRIRPAVDAARQRGVRVEGPFPADTLMARAAGGEFDMIVAMYHDQGHIAIKLLGMHDAVNVTLGLPIIRTSVAHGTAFDQAWQGTAQSDGMHTAIRTACDLVISKSKTSEEAAQSAPIVIS